MIRYFVIGLLVLGLLTTGLFFIKDNGSFQSLFENQGNGLFIDFQELVETKAVNLTFVSPTPAAGAGQTSNQLAINMTSDASGLQHYSFLDYDNTLVLWFPFDHVNASGSPLDLSGNGFNATLINSTINQSLGGPYSNYSRSLQSRSRIEVQNGWTHSTNNLTWSLWIRSNLTAAGTKNAMTTSEGAGGASVSISSTNINSLRGSVGSGSDAIWSGWNGSDDLWHHIVYRRNDNGTHSLWVDGVMRASAAGPAGTLNLASNNFLNIGSRNLGSDNWTAEFDEVIIFDRYLGNQEILALYNATATANQYYNNFSNVVDGVHTYKGYAMVSNASYSNTTTRNFTIDAGSPVITINSPENRTYGLTSILLNITTNELAQAAWYSLNNGATNISMSSSNSLNWNRTATSVPDGSNTFRFWANDSFNNIGNASITLSVNSTVPVIRVQTSKVNGTAPMGVFFDASYTESQSVPNDDSFWQLNFDWDFNDPNSQFLNFPNANATHSKGALASHVFNQSGNYTVQLNVTDINGTSSLTSIAITVNSPDSVYNGATYCVSSTADFGDCPVVSSAFHINYTNFTSLATTFFGTNGPRRMLFNRGDTFNASGDSLGQTTNGPFLMDAYGTGANPRFYHNNSNSTYLQFTSTLNDFTITNVDFIGPYDAQSGIGNHPDGIWFFDATNVTLYRNNFNGLGLNIHLVGSGGTDDNVDTYFIADNNITNWQDYGLLGGVYHGAIIGNWIKQNPLAVSRNDSKCGSCVPNAPDHGPVRLALASKSIAMYNDLFNNAGWSSNGAAHQPPLRLGTGGDVDQFIVSGNRMEGGFSVASTTLEDTTAAGYGKNVVWERNYFLASNNTETMQSIGQASQIIRNNIYIKPANGNHTGLGCGEFCNVIEAGNPFNTTDLNTRSYIYGNSFIGVDPNSTEVSFLTVVVGNLNRSFFNFTIKNNLFYSPFARDTEAGFIKWETSFYNLTAVESNNNLYWTNRTNRTFVYQVNTAYNISQWRNNTGQDNQTIQFDPLFASLSGFNAVLSAASPAINNGTNVTGLFEDYNETRRPFNNQWDIGAMEFNNATDAPDVNLSNVNGSISGATWVGDLYLDLIENTDYTLTGTSFELLNNERFEFSQINISMEIEGTPGSSSSAVAALLRLGGLMIPIILIVILFAVIIRKVRGEDD